MNPLRAIIIFLIVANYVIWSQGASSLTYRFDKVTALVNATIYIDYKTRLDSGILILHKGRIIEAGKNIKIPEGAEVLDYSGKVIYPSFIDICTDYGVGEQRSIPGSRPHYETTVKGAFNINQAIKPEISADQHFKHDPARAKLLRELGFGTVVTANADGIIRGTSATVLLADLPEKDLIIGPHTGLHFSFQKGSSSQEYPSSLMGSIALIRQTLYDAEAYAKNKGKVPYDISLEKLNAFKGKPWLFESGNVLNALRALKIANEFGAKVLLHAHGDEYQQLEQLKQSNPFLIVSLNFPEAFKIASPKDAEYVSNLQLMEWYFAPFNIAKIFQQKIDFAITTHYLKDLKDFRKNLQRVFETGVPETEILKSLTYNPAQQMGLYQQVGSLQPGKYANFIISNVNLAAKGFKVHENWVKGEKYEISKMDKDFTGVYKLMLKNYPEYKLEINSKLEKPKAFLTKFEDTTKHFLDLEIKGEMISLTLNLAKLDSNIKNKVYLKSYAFDGKSFKGLASNTTWTQDVPFEAVKYAELTLKDTTEIAKVKIPMFGVPKPFNAYGSDSVSKLSNYIIKNATLWTGEQPFELKDYDLVIVDGIIKSIGKNINARKYFASGIAYAEIDAQNKYVTAGIIDEHSHIALNGGVNEVGESVTAEVRIQDVINPADINIYRQLAGGVTTSHILHGSANCIGGQSALINLKWGLSADKLLFKNHMPFIKFALGENVKQANWGDKYVVRYPQTRMGVEQTFIDAFQRAVEYKEAKESFASKPSTIKLYPRKDLELETIQEILEQKRFITCHSYSQSEINMLMKVAEKYHIKVNTFTHVLEGYKIAEKLKTHGAGASSFSDWWSFKAEVKDAIPQNAAILHQHGVVVAINSDDAEMGRRLNQEAAKSVKYGDLSQEEAWRLVTLNPARLLRINDKVGSLKEGKLANIVIWSTNPLSIYAKPEQVFVEGVKYYDDKYNTQLEERNRMIRKQLLQELLNDKSPEDKKVLPKPEKQKHYHCDTFETLD